MSRVCGCYVDADKNIVSTFNENFLGLPDEDLFKYLDILKKSLGGKFGNNLFDIEFSTESEKHGGNQQILMAIRDSDLKMMICLHLFMNILLMCIAMQEII